MTVLNRHNPFNGCACVRYVLLSHALVSFRIANPLSVTIHSIQPGECLRGVCVCMYVFVCCVCLNAYALCARVLCAERECRMRAYIHIHIHIAVHFAHARFTLWWLLAVCVWCGCCCCRSTADSTLGRPYYIPKLRVEQRQGTSVAAAAADDDYDGDAGDSSSNIDTNIYMFMYMLYTV